MSSGGLLIDTNVLVLFTVGSVNPARIEAFKRTNRYTKADFELLLEVLENFDPLYTVAHILAEVSNLTDLAGIERLQARLVLKTAISSLVQEVEMPSIRAAEDPLYNDLGLADAAIGALARTHKCTVLTDDLDLYVRLSRDHVRVINFAHLRAQQWGV
jgi:predicted nucleic acid-binding protein